MPYNYINFDENGLNTGPVSCSYFSKDIQSLYEQTYLNSDKFFGQSESDIVEFSLYNNSQELISFNRLIPKTTFSIINGSYYDINNKLISYNFAKPFTNYFKFENNILIDTKFNLNSIGVSPGLYYLLYNFIRNVAGNNKNRLVIKEISPNRTELRLSFAFNPSLSNENALEATKISAFSDKKFLFLLISDLVNKIIDENPISTNFKQNSSEFNYNEIIQNLGLKSIGELEKFIIETYVGFDKIQLLSKNNSDQLIQESLKFIGIDDQLKNFTYTYNNYEFTQQEILLAFETIITKVSQDRILQKTSINEAQLAIILNLFVKIIYKDWIEPQISSLLEEYSIKFFGLYKNVLNFDNGKYVKILTHTSYLNPIDNRVNLQIKLDEPLPTEFNIRTTCWISNISISPIYFKTNLFTEAVSKKVYLNGVNFDVEINKSNSLTEDYAAHSNQTIFEAKSRLKNKINDLLIDYDNFNNFIIYSSAELRTKIAKNKISDFNKKENLKKSIEDKIVDNLPKTISSSYSIQKNEIIKQQIELLESFDGYESYLFFNTSSINQKINEGVEYDKNNLDSLMNQLPSYLKETDDSVDYLKFTSMVGHLFDNILVYIKKFPKTYPVGTSEINDYPKNLLDELLNSFNWISPNINLENKNLKSYLFDNRDYPDLFSSSYFDYGKVILNRFANNLPYIYKTKGTGTSISLIRSLFGIPTELIQLREYGSTDVNVNKQNYFDFEDVVYLTKYDSDQYITFNHTGSEYNFNRSKPYLSKTFLYTDCRDIPYYKLVLNSSIVEQFYGINTFEAGFKFSSNVYDRNQKINLIKKIRNDKIDWKIYIKKTKQIDSGILTFDFHPYESGITSSLSLDELPLLNGNFYTLILTRDTAEEYNYDEIPNIINTSSVIEYENNGEVYLGMTSSLSSSNAFKYLPNKYTLSVHQYDGSLKNFESVKNKIIYYNQNQYFSSGSYYIGNYEQDVLFKGYLDKIKVFRNNLGSEDFNEHGYNVDSISIPDKENVYKNLLFLWSFDAPIDLWSHSELTKSVIVPNQNLYFQTSGSVFENYFKAFNFRGKIKYKSHPICKNVEESEFPYQFDKFIFNQAINANRYGPNYNNNLKINKVDEFTTSNLVPYDYSTKTNDVLGSDSNMIGFYISPYTYLNQRMENFLGKEGITDVIGDPKYLTKQNYPDLDERLKYFSLLNEKYIYPQEFYSTYKFYIDFSIFDYIKKLIPSRASVKKGLLIEPSILERKKYNYKDIRMGTDGFTTSSILFDNKASLNFNIDSSSTMSISSFLTTNVDTDRNQYNYSMFEIKDKIDDRDYIYTKTGKYFYLNKNLYSVNSVYNIKTSDSYQDLDSLGTYKTFTSSFYKTELVGSGSLTGSKILTDFYKGIESSGYSYRHLSKLNRPGSRHTYLSILSSSKYTIKNGVKVSGGGTIKYYNYVKGKNDKFTTVNRSGLPNNSEPVISIPGFINLNISSSLNTINSVPVKIPGTGDYISKRIPLTASMENSSSLDMYIMNL